MKRLKTMDDVAHELGCGGIRTVDDLVDELINLGNTDKVFVRYDDHLGLKEDLSEEFLKARLSETDKPEFKAEIENILEHANIIILLSQRDLTPKDLHEIREDKISRGEDTDE